MIKQIDTIIEPEEYNQYLRARVNYLIRHIRNTEDYEQLNKAVESIVCKNGEFSNGNSLKEQFARLWAERLDSRQSH